MPNADGERSSRRRLAAAIVVGVVAVDQATKTWAVAVLDDGPRSIVGGDVELRLSRNTGGAFSLFQGFSALLAVFAAVLTLLLIRALRRTTDTWIVVGLALVLGGAAGNLVDRAVRSPGVLRGAVVDFVSVLGFPTFNVADAAITIGAVLLLVRVVFGDRHDEQVEPSA